jgi:hypothetical protein
MVKRIIDGATYNTQTATLIAEGTSEDANWGTAEQELYQNRAGIFFAIEKVTKEYKDRNDEWRERTTSEWYVLGDAVKARNWCERNGLTILRDIDDMPPEAEFDAEKLSTLYVRLPPVLKKAIEDAAQANKASTNNWVMRCVERCLDEHRENAN